MQMSVPAHENPKVDALLKAVHNSVVLGNQENLPNAMADLGYNADQIDEMSQALSDMRAALRDAKDIELDVKSDPYSFIGITDDEVNDHLEALGWLQTQSKWNDAASWVDELASVCDEPQCPRALVATSKLEFPAQPIDTGSSDDIWQADR